MNEKTKPIGGSPQTSEAAKKAANEITHHIETFQHCKGYGALGIDEIREVAENVIQSAIDAAARSFSEPCDVCGGTGTPVSKRPCICNGSGLMSIAVIELRKLLFDAERKLDAAARVEPTTKWNLCEQEGYVWLFNDEEGTLTNAVPANEEHRQLLTRVKDAHNASCAPTTTDQNLEGATPLARGLSRDETGNLPCPFCGSQDINTSDGSYECRTCGAMGPCEPMARPEHWNGRVALSSTQTTKPTLTEGKESPSCAVKDQKGDKVL